jgi:plastocyanin
MMLVLGACASGSTADVVVKDFKFDPSALDVDAGTTVAWTSEDTVLHTVTSGDVSGAENEADGTFAGELAAKGSTFEHTFEDAGTYTYFCSQHNVMNGTVTVR